MIVFSESKWHICLCVLDSTNIRPLDADEKGYKFTLSFAVSPELRDGFLIPDPGYYFALRLKEVPFNGDIQYSRDAFSCRVRRRTDGTASQNLPDIYIEHKGNLERLQILRGDARAGHNFKQNHSERENVAHLAKSSLKALWCEIGNGALRAVPEVL